MRRNSSNCLPFGMLTETTVNNSHALFINQIHLLPIGHRDLMQSHHNHTSIHDLLLLPNVLLPLRLPRQKALKKGPKKQRMTRRNNHIFRQNPIVENRSTKFLQSNQSVRRKGFVPPVNRRVDQGGKVVHSRNVLIAPRRMCDSPRGYNGKSVGVARNFLKAGQERDGIVRGRSPGRDGESIGESDGRGGDGPAQIGRDDVGFRGSSVFGLQRQEQTDRPFLFRIGKAPETEFLLLEKLSESLALFDALAAESRVEEPGVGVFAADEEVELHDDGVNHVGDEEEEEDEFVAIAGVEGVVPRGFAVADEKDGFGFVGRPVEFGGGRAAHFFGEVGGRVVFGYLEALVVAEEEVEDAEVGDFEFSDGGGGVGEDAQDGDEDEGAAEGGEEMGDVDEDERWEGE
mmetsp:Transcript_21281/g.42661  ORF Transcript_21281/g.42661 Transcript_21281/m.42661 type:complete len:401 (+) Transcript_21281:218-1420(+)